MIAGDGGAVENASESVIKILAKPSDYVEAYFEDTAGLVEGVSDVFYSKNYAREIDSAAKRTNVLLMATLMVQMPQEVFQPLHLQME